MPPTVGHLIGQNVLYSIFLDMHCCQILLKRQVSKTIETWLLLQKQTTGIFNEPQKICCLHLRINLHQGWLNHLERLFVADFSRALLHHGVRERLKHESFLCRRKLVYDPAS